MLKNISNLGKSLNKAEQLLISGGHRLYACTSLQVLNGCYEIPAQGCICPVSEV